MNPYDAIRKEVQQEIAELRAFLEYLDRMEARQTGQVRGSAGGSSTATGKLSNAAETWAESVGRVMMEAGRPITLVEIREALVAGGRKVAPGSKGTNQIRNTIFREKEKRGWKKVGTRGNRALWTVNGAPPEGEEKKGESDFG